MVFTNYVYEKRSLAMLGKLTRRTPGQIRRILFEVDQSLASSNAPAPRGGLTADSPIEALDLSVRSRNALRRLGCGTIGDLTALDLTRSLRQIGSKGKMEVLAALARDGFRHPALDAAPSAEVSRLTRSLERLKLRITKTLSLVTREISALQERLAKAGESL
jgi:DNA-directed RNA polymerase alpha subunit